MTIKIHCIQLPTPPPMDSANAYLVACDPVTIIDSGFRGEAAEEVLKEELKKLGFSISDVRRIALTHGHQDHYSLAADVFDRDGIEVYIHRNDYEKIDGTYEDRFVEGKQLFYDFYRHAGMPEDITEDTVNRLGQGLWGYRTSFGQPVTFLNDGDRLEFDGGALEVIYSPGHSFGSVCFYEKSNGILISGDQVLARALPNPVLDICNKDSYNQKFGVKQIYQSLDKLSELGLNKILPGHGEEITEIEKVFSGYMRFKERFSRAIIRHLEKEKGPATPFDMYYRIYKRMPGIMIYIGMSIITGLLNVLEEEGAVSSYEEEGGLIYRLV